MGYRRLEVAARVLAGEIEYRRGNFDIAFDHLRQAVALDERLNYDEPWGWMQPTRHALGALLQEARAEQERFKAALRRWAKARGVRVVAVAMRGETRPVIAGEVDRLGGAVDHVHPGALGEEGVRGGLGFFRVRSSLTLWVSFFATQFTLGR